MKFVAALTAGLLVLSTGATAQQSETFKIGLATDMSSAYADLSGRGSVVATQMAIEDFGGSVLGRRIELITADHQMKPSVASALITEWFDRQNVSVITGLAGSSVALAAQAILKDRPQRVNIYTTAFTTELAGKSCLPNGIHWAPDSYSLAVPLVRYLAEKGGKTWFLMLQDTAVGTSALAAASEGIQKGGGRIIGDVRIPFNAGDVSSFVLQAQSSRAQMVAVGFGGGDLVNIVKAGRQFGMTQKSAGGATFVALSLFSTDIEAMGLELAQGITFIMPWYPDMNEGSRAWAKRFQQRAGKLPTFGHIADYESILHYLRAVQKVGTDDARKVIPAMKATPINSFSLENGAIRDDNRLIRPMYLARVKSPAQSKGPGDYYEIISKLPGNDAFMPLSRSDCGMVKK